MAKIEYWVKNRTTADLVSSELRLKIPSGGRPVNLCALNPELTHEALSASEQDEGGFLFRCFFAKKLVKIPFAPARPQYRVEVKQEAPLPLPSRVKTSVVIDTKQQDFIEELTRFDDLDGDGFVDVFADGGPGQVEGESGENFGQKPFSVVAIKPALGNPVDSEIPLPTKGKLVERKSKNSREIVVEPED